MSKPGPGPRLSEPLLTSPPATAPTDEFISLPPVKIGTGSGKRPQPCVNRAEPLQLLNHDGPVAYLDAYSRLGVFPARPGRLRVEVIERLEQAAASLPAGYSLVVLDSWRTLEEQIALGQFYGSQSVTGGFVAPTGAGRRPPHTTGGAVDLTLAWEGQPLALGTDFDDFTPLAATGAFEEPGRDSRIKLLRRALAAGLTMAGFVNHRLGYEWWHWSFGDDTWADFNRCSALYGIAGLDDVDDAIPSSPAR